MSPVPERIFLALVLAAGLGAAWFARTSTVAETMRRGTPLMALIHMTGKDNPSSSDYILIYSWKDRILNLVHAGRQTSDIIPKDIMTVTASLPARFGLPGDLQAVKAWILSCPYRLRIAPPLHPYDAALLVLEIYRLRPGSVRLAWLPDPPLEGRFLDSILFPAAPSQTGSASSTTTVEVLNASGEARVALQATKVLRLRQADVVEFGNAPAEAARTHILDLTGNFALADGVRRTLGCDRAEVFSRLEANPRAAVAVVLGKDYRNCVELNRRMK